MGKGKVGDSKILVPVGKEIFKNIKFNYPGSVPVSMLCYSSI